jgi:endonuclease YncB( thermonuclease family)
VPPQSDAALGIGVLGSAFSVSYRAILAFGLAVMLAGAARADDKSPCALANLGSGTVRAALDGRTLALADGREVRLAGIEVPGEAKSVLQALAEGREITLGRLGSGGPETDRYGRLVAAVSLDSGPDSPPVRIENSLQAALLAHGLARVSARAGNAGCARALLKAEQTARTAGLGVWGDAAYLTRNAEDFGGILALKGRFAVEGKVLSVRESGATVYVNFGRRWSEDFTVTVPKRSERSFAAAGLTLKNLTGHNVRVRGTIEERGGPWIEPSAPEQIEVVEHD